MSANSAKGHGTSLEAARERAILALLSERTLGGAARRCGVNERTLRRWMSDDEDFKKQLAEARRAAFAQGMQRVHALTTAAVDTLAALLKSNMPPSVRLGAARTIAELGLRQYDTDVILRRLEELESKTQLPSTGRW